MKRISDIQLDILKEVINIGVGKAAGALNEMLHEHIALQVPNIQVFTLPELRVYISQFGANKLAAVYLTFRGPFAGTASLIFPPDSAIQLVNILTDQEDDSFDDLDSIRIGTLSEVGNIVINGVLGTISNMLKQHLSYSIPTYQEHTLDMLLIPQEQMQDTIVLAQTRFILKNLQIVGDLYLIFEVGGFDALLIEIDHINTTC